ncbi:MAG: zinc-binding dehydrogenase [Clostridia bacterium]|nr:zinc-binding dehydrogenase [Clostridia bacterium]
MKQGDVYGIHRVVSPKGVLPQPAEKLDNNMEIYDNEVLINVKTLNIDSASFTEIARQAKIQLGIDEKTPNTDEAVKGQTKKIIKDIVAKTGKHKNPWTGSGGMLIGTVEEIGENFEGTIKVGDKIATLVSLSLTPLVIDEILDIRPEIDQVDIIGHAILFQSGLYAKLPDDMPEGLALSALDVAGAPAQAAKLCRPGNTVVVIGGGGKSGLLCLYEAKKHVGVTGKVICVAGSPKSEERARKLDLADEYCHLDATDAVAVYEKISELTNGELADVVINVVNIENTEMASILACKDDGVVYFFSMATSFTKAALGAEGVGKDVNMMIGNGYCKGHAEVTLQCLREHPGIKKLFEEMYA